MEREILIKSFIMNISGSMYIIKKVVVKIDCVITDITRYYQDNIQITKEYYLQLEKEYEK